MIDLADLKTYIGLTTTTAEQDALLTQLEAAALAHMERSTHRYFGPPKLVVEELAGNARGHLWLTHEPIAAADVVVTERWRASDEGTLIDDARLDGRRIRRDYFWGLGYTYTAEYLAGYGPGTGEFEDIAGPDVPADVWRAVAEIVKASWQARTSNEAMKSETIGGYSYTRADGGGVLAIPSFAQSVIQNWQRKFA